MQADKLPTYLIALKKMKRRERTLQERDQDAGLLSLNEQTASDLKQTVAYVLAEKQLKAALWKSLSLLSSEEFGYIEEFFFLREENDTLSSFAKKHGVARQTYTRHLHRILRKLQDLIKENAHDADDLYKMLFF